MDQTLIAKTVAEMIAAPSCCPELRAAGQKYLDAVGTIAENPALIALRREISEDICTLDQTIPFFESTDAVEIFGEKRAKEMAEHARALKASGAKWCDCPACAAGLKILEGKLK